MYMKNEMYLTNVKWWALIQSANDSNGGDGIRAKSQQRFY